MGDEEEEVKLYKYDGERAEGETVSVTGGEPPKVLTEDKKLLGLRHGATATPTEYPSGDTYAGSYAAGWRVEAATSGSGRLAWRKAESWRSTAER